MRKYFFVLVAVVGFSFSTFAQNVVIQTNEISKSKKTNYCAYRIGGICTTEDIGGVEVARGSNSSGDYYHLVFENYNSFIVTVIFEVQTEYGNKKTGTIVLKPDERKETQDIYWSPSNFKLIVRKLAK